MQPSGEFSLYFHVPFCTRKCDYCHFYVIPNERRYQALYMEALKQEWALRSPLLPKEGELVSIYFGGGTPALLGPDNIATILSWINPPEGCEITLEANPEEIGGAFPGINRFSLGVQSFDDQELTTLTRGHNSNRARDAILEIVQNGIANLSIDLMYDLPGQTVATWEKTLETALSLPISHLSLYNLTIEPHTSYYKRREKLQSHLPGDQASLKMLKMAVEKAEASGLKRYEISAFAKPGAESRHNTGYWKGRPFLGFGPSAFSYWEGARFQNHPNLNRYAKKVMAGEDPTHFHEKLSPLESQKERLAVRLRLLEPLEEWPPELQNIYTTLCEESFLEDNLLKLSNKGLLFHDSVAELIMK